MKAMSQLETKNLTICSSVDSHKEEKENRFRFSLKHLDQLDLLFTFLLTNPTRYTYKTSNSQTSQYDD